METEKKLAHDAIIDSLKNRVVSLKLACYGSRNEFTLLNIIFALGMIMENIIISEEHKKEIIDSLRDIQNDIINTKKYPNISSFLEEVINKI